VSLPIPAEKYCPNLLGYSLGKRGGGEARKEEINKPVFSSIVAVLQIHERRMWGGIGPYIYK
jgi:hypothetical protein